MFALPLVGHGVNGTILILQFLLKAGLNFSAISIVISRYWSRIETLSFESPKASQDDSSIVERPHTVLVQVGVFQQVVSAYAPWWDG